MKIPAAIILALLTFTIISLTIPKLNGFGPQPIKQELAYRQAYQDIHQLILNQLLTTTNQSQDTAVVNQFKAIFTLDYVTTKVDHTLDQSAAWITGASDQEPTVTFNDAKQSLLDRFDSDGRAAQALSQLQDLSAQHTLPQVTDNPQLQQLLTDSITENKTITAFSQGDFTIHLGSYLSGLKFSYSIYTILLWLLPLLWLAGLTIGLLRRPTAPSRLRLAGFYLLSSGVGAGLLLTVTHVIGLVWFMPYLYNRLSHYLPLASTLAQSGLNPLFSHYLVYGLAIAAGLSLLGLIFTIIARRLDQSSQPKPQTPLQPQPQSAPSSISQLTNQPGLE